VKAPCVGLHQIGPELPFLTGQSAADRHRTAIEAIAYLRQASLEWQQKCSGVMGWRNCSLFFLQKYPMFSAIFCENGTQSSVSSGLMCWIVCMS
jgi:hypothetical protein